MAAHPASTLATRRLVAGDLAEVVRIDTVLTGLRKPDYWQRVFRDFLGRKRRRGAFGQGVDGEGGRLAGYLFGEVRAFEFGSEPCGWVLAIGVDRPHQRRGVAAALLRAARGRFRRAGVETVRTMVRRNDVPFLTFFRSQGFIGGPFVQLELDLTEES